MRTFKVVNWSEYNEARRYGKWVPIKDYIEEVELKFERLPGYEHLSQAEYKKLMQEKLEARRLEIAAKRGRPALGRDALLAKIAGSRPKNTKTSGINSHRPRILCKNPEQRHYFKNWYFDIYFKFKEASLRYRSGELNVEFPPGTYKPPVFTCKALKANH